MKDMELNKRIGSLLRAEREKSNMSLADVAFRMGYSSRNTISIIELGTTQITVEQLQRYCDAVECDMFEILRKAQNACI